MFHKKAWNTQFTQRSLAIEIHLLTARFPQRSLSQSYQKRFAQNIPPIRSSQNKLSPLSEAFLCTCTAASLYTNSGIHTKSHIEAHVPLLTAASPHRQQDNQHFVTKKIGTKCSRIKMEILFFYKRMSCHLANFASKWLIKSNK